MGAVAERLSNEGGWALEDELVNGSVAGAEEIDAEVTRPVHDGVRVPRTAIAMGFAVDREFAVGGGRIAVPLYRRGVQGELEDGRVTHAGKTPHRYVWPSEMDVMAKMAGLEFTHRYADWDKSEFTGDSTSGVSVWRKPE